MWHIFCSQIVYQRSQDLASFFTDRNAIIVTVNSSIPLHLFAELSILSLYMIGVLEPASYCFNHYSFVIRFNNWQCQFPPQYSFQILIDYCPFFLLSFDRWSFEGPIQKSWNLTETMYNYVLVWKSFCIFYNDGSSNSRELCLSIYLSLFYSSGKLFFFFFSFLDLSHYGYFQVFCISHIIYKWFPIEM